MHFTKCENTSVKVLLKKPVQIVQICQLLRKKWGGLSLQHLSCTCQRELDLCACVCPECGSVSWSTTAAPPAQWQALLVQILYVKYNRTKSVLFSDVTKSYLFVFCLSQKYFVHITLTQITRLSLIYLKLALFSAILHESLFSLQI